MMEHGDETELGSRKMEHIEIVRNRGVEPRRSPFAHWRLPYRALPELDLAGLDSSITFLGRRLSFPLIISSMTGGPLKAAEINHRLALAAQSEGVALALGSMRICLNEPASHRSFQVRHLCPDVPLLANIGMVQLNYGVDAEALKRMVDLVEADGLYLHLNALQEAIQPEGDTNFANLSAKLEALVKAMPVPVLVKEVGSGIDPVSARKLVDTGITWIDVAGSGGTSWSQVEGYRRQDRLGHIFRAVGIPTDEALSMTRDIAGIRLIASGGVRSGLDVALGLLLGAELAASAKPFLEPALEDEQATAALIAQWRREFRVAMFCCGAADIASLRRMEPIRETQGP